MKLNIEQELKEFKEPITILDGWEYSQKDTVEQDICYYNSKYVEGDIDSDGLKLYFYNISRAACGTTTKAIDIDTKDFRLSNAPGGNALKTWFYERDLKYWLKSQQFGKVLNRIARELPQFGSVVLKYNNGDVHFVDLRNFICEQNADSLDLSNYIIEQHYYTPTEFKRVGKKKGWENVDKVIDLYRGSKEQYIRVFERYGEVEDNGFYDYKMVLVADIPTDIKKSDLARFEINDNIILGEKLVDRHPYKEIHINKIPGRWLGMGIPEILSENQIRINEIFNQQVKSSYWNSLRLWQTRDPGAGRNLLTDSQNGDILVIEDPLQPVDMQDRNLSHFVKEVEMWESNARSQTFSTDIMRGERTPAGTPLGAAQLSTAQAMSFFDQMREDYVLEIKDLFWRFVIPGFRKTSNKEHIVKIVGEDVQYINELIKQTNVDLRVKEYIRTTGKVPTTKEIEMFKKLEDVRNENVKERDWKIPEGWYKDIMFDFDIIITDESQSAAVLAQALIQAFQMIQADPTTLTDPVKKGLFSQYLEKIGINLYDIESKIIKNDEPVMQPTGPAGGGVSAPGVMIGATGEQKL